MFWEKKYSVDLPDVPEGTPRWGARYGLNRDGETVETLHLKLPMPVRAGTRASGGRYHQRLVLPFDPVPGRPPESGIDPTERWVYGVRTFTGFGRGHVLEAAIAVEVWASDLREDGRPQAPGLRMYQRGPHKEEQLGHYEAFHREMFPWPVLGCGVTVAMTCACTGKNLRSLGEAGVHFGLVLFNVVDVPLVDIDASGRRYNKSDFAGSADKNRVAPVSEKSEELCPCGYESNVCLRGTE